MKKTILTLVIAVLAFSAITADAQLVGNSSVQTNSATNISNYQATLQGNLSIPYYSSSSNYVWFQWGTTNSYGNETNHQLMSSGLFSQNITGLNTNTLYHFRAVAQINNGSIYYGQDMTFYSSSSNYYNNGSFIINKKVVNLSSGNQNWSEFISARPNDVLSFAVIIQTTNNQEIHNVFLHDILPQNLIYKGNLMINSTLSYSGDPTYGVTIGTIPAGQTTIVSYQAQVAGSQNFNYGSTTLTNMVTVTSNETGSQTDSATVFVNNSSTAGATSISTGLTNNFFTDSFFLPLMIILLSAWLYFSGRIYKFSDWLKLKIKK